MRMKERVLLPGLVVAWLTVPGPQPLAADKDRAVSDVLKQAPDRYAALSEPDGAPLEERQQALEDELARSDSRETRLALARVMRDRGRIKKGLRVLEPLLAADPMDDAVRALRNDLMLVRIRTAGVFGKMSAGNDYRRACEADLERDPDDGRALLCLARYYANAPAIAGGSDKKARIYRDRLKAADSHG